MDNLRSEYLGIEVKSVDVDGNDSWSSPKEIAAGSLTGGNAFIVTSGPIELCSQADQDEFSAFFAEGVTCGATRKDGSRYKTAIKGGGSSSKKVNRPKPA
jgi:hypothetical protein|tara:strand:- start:204 stop:503 length:300 start_codon:yes stop_codon:yes gene_type:complete